MRRNCRVIHISGKLKNRPNNKYLLPTVFTQVSPQREVFNVSKLNRLARTILESEIGQIWLSAEISNLVIASSGHWYFTLKDNKAQIRAAMFKGSNRKVTQRPKEGDKVLVRANLSLYEARGDYQLIVEHLEPEGQGDLKQAFEQLKIQLASEGLFAHEHKMPLPDSINKVGVITSATGAALHDILTVLNRRNPAISVIVYPAQVQGEQAPEQLIQALHLANQRNEVEVIILGRGGGSLEDLWCFNNETLARAIFASQLPIVSAVGHEVDVTISDFVADLRAATPSAAAELISQDQQQLMQQIDRLSQRLIQSWRQQQQQAQLRQQNLLHKLQQQHPQRQLEQQAQRLERAQHQLHQTIQSRLQNANIQQQQLTHQLQLHQPQGRIGQLQQYKQMLLDKLQQAMQQQLLNQQQQLAKHSALLNSVSPLATLSRGYNIAYKQGKIVKSAAQLNPGEQITSRFADGEVVSEVLPTQQNMPLEQTY